jgi:Flp pilus assembly protein TadD
MMRFQAQEDGIMSTVNKSFSPRFSWLSAACAALIGVSANAASSDKHLYELIAHDDEVYGKYALLEGDVDVAIERFESRLNDGISNSRRAALLVNLCAAYTMKQNFAMAEQRCNAAVESGWSTKKALNNRGIMQVARGDYLAAVDDFQQAADSRATGRYGRHLLQARMRLENLSDDARFADANEISSESMLALASR